MVNHIKLLKKKKLARRYKLCAIKYDGADILKSIYKIQCNKTRNLPSTKISLTICHREMQFKPGDKFGSLRLIPNKIEREGRSTFRSSS